MKTNIKKVTVVGFPFAARGEEVFVGKLGVAQCFDMMGDTMFGDAYRVLGHEELVVLEPFKFDNNKFWVRRIVKVDEIHSKIPHNPEPYDDTLPF